MDRDPVHHMPSVLKNVFEPRWRLERLDASQCPYPVLHEHARPSWTGVDRWKVQSLGVLQRLIQKPRFSRQVEVKVECVNQFQLALFLLWQPPVLKRPTAVVAHVVAFGEQEPRG